MSIIAEIKGAILSAAQKTWLVDGLTAVPSGSNIESVTGSQAKADAAAAAAQAAAEAASTPITAMGPQISPTYLSYSDINTAYTTAVGSAASDGAAVTIIYSGAYYHAVFSSAGVWYLLNMTTGTTSSLVDYEARVLALSPLAYWPMTETTGTTADNAEGTSARDGTYSGVTLASADGPDGQPSPLFDGINDFLNIYTASLVGAVDMQEISISAWVKVSGAGVWSDGNTRRATLMRVNANNQLTMLKNPAAGQFEFRYVAGATADVVTKTSVSNTDWVHVGITVSLSNDRMIAYWNGAQEGATQTGLGTFAGALDADRVAIGSDNTATPGLVWDGYLSHVAIFSGELSAANMATLANVGA